MSPMGNRSDADGSDEADVDVAAAAELPTVFEGVRRRLHGRQLRGPVEGDLLLYEHRRTGYEPHRAERVRPRRWAWASFARWLQVIEPWGWNGEYRLPPEMMVMDGSHWRLRLTWMGGRIDANGDNAYPPYGDGPDLSPHWDLFCTAVQRLLGGLRFG